MLTRQHPVTRSRCVLVVVATTAGAVQGGRPLARWLRAPVDTAEDAVVALCLFALLLGLGWAWLATVTVVVEAWRGSPVAGRGVPAVIRRLVLLGCGAALALPAGPAMADTGIDGLPLPDRPTSLHQEPATHGRVADRGRSVVVTPGDSLWLVAAADLPHRADAARITDHWRAIYRLNADVIGPDPDVIHPGQRLALPRRSR